VERQNSPRPLREGGSSREGRRRKGQGFERRIPVGTRIPPPSPCRMEEGENASSAYTVLTCIPCGAGGVWWIVRCRTMFHVKHIGNGRKVCLACHLSRRRLIARHLRRLTAIWDDGGLTETAKRQDVAERPRNPSPQPSRPYSKGADMLLAPNRWASAHPSSISQPNNPSPRRRRPLHGGCCSSAAPSRPRSARRATSVRSDHPNGRFGISCPQARPTHRREKR
jgi:hypothetical protein